MAETNVAKPAGVSTRSLDSAAVYWIGHSLIEGKAETPSGPIDLMTMVGDLAKAAGLNYSFGDHTLWGSSLSVLWRGQAHGYDRQDSAMIAKRKAFQKDPGNYDTIVMTEVLPLSYAVKGEFSAHYARRFYCAIKQAKPDARVFLYQAWVNFQGHGPEAKDPPAYLFDWRAEMNLQRKLWERIANEAVAKKVAAPGWLSRFGIHARSDGGCAARDPILLVPVGATLVAIYDALAKGGDQVASLKLADGRPLSMADFFANPYINWPQNWPLKSAQTDGDLAAKFAKLKLRDPSKPHDDIHMSALGIYLSALVHFATIYRRSPVGLPHPDFVGKELGNALGCLAWKTVMRDPRSGVSSVPHC